MQDNKKNLIDTRTFQEIWKSLGMSSPQQMELRDLIIKKLSTTRQSINNWGNGTHAPVRPGDRKNISVVINAYLGIKTSPYTLFPSAR